MRAPSATVTGDILTAPGGGAPRRARGGVDDALSRSVAQATRGSCLDVLTPASVEGNSRTTLATVRLRAAKSSGCTKRRVAARSLNERALIARLAQLSFDGPRKVAHHVGDGLEQPTGV